MSPAAEPVSDPGPPATVTARVWTERLRTLQDLRRQFTQAPQAFRWLIQSRILVFLLHKYGTDPTLDDRREPSAPQEPWVCLVPDAIALPRPGEFFRPFLEEISRANRAAENERIAADYREALERNMALARASVRGARSAAAIRAKEAAMDATLRAAAAARKARRRRIQQALEARRQKIEQAREARRQKAQDALAARSAAVLESAWQAAEPASATPPSWPQPPAGFVGLALAGIGKSVAEADLATILDFHLRAGQEQCLVWSRQVMANQPLTIPADRTTARWLAADLRALGVRVRACG